MKNIPYLTILLVMVLFSCRKSGEYSLENPVAVESLTDFTKYTIPKGKQYADKNIPASVSYRELKFQVKFDGSANYRTLDPANQDDINKLYGFSDNNAQHHLYSARIGWRWSNDSLRLFAYIYNNALRSSKEISTVEVGKLINCSILVEDGQYVFTVNNKKLSMPREATTPVANGYRLYPYFGGDEMAPHEISIWIKEIN